MKPAIPVILNARAGTGGMPPDTDRLQALFRGAGLNAELLLAHDGSETTALARDALKQQPRLIVAGGGDGTINAVAAQLAESATVLGVLPLGTLNHFARDLRIPAELEAAVRVLATGTVLRVDVGRVNGHTFLNNSSIGLYPGMVHHREQLQQRLGKSKWSALLQSSLLMLRRYPLLDVQVRVGGRDFQRRTPLVFVGNNAYAMEGLAIGMRERLDAGSLSLYIPRSSGRLALFAIAFRALLGRLRADAGFDSLLATQIQIETRGHHLRVAIDGEVVHAEPPLRYRIRKKALRVMVPGPGTEKRSSG